MNAVRDTAAVTVEPEWPPGITPSGVLG